MPISVRVVYFGHLVVVSGTSSSALRYVERLKTYLENNVCGLQETNYFIFYYEKLNGMKKWNCGRRYLIKKCCVYKRKHLKKDNVRTYIYCMYVYIPDIDECAILSNPCGANAVCINADPGYECVCPQGFRALQSPHIACEQVKYF